VSEYVPFEFVEIKKPLVDLTVIFADKLIPLIIYDLGVETVPVCTLPNDKIFGDVVIDGVAVVIFPIKGSVL